LHLPYVVPVSPRDVLLTKNTEKFKIKGVPTLLKRLFI